VVIIQIALGIVLAVIILMALPYLIAGALWLLIIGVIIAVPLIVLALGGGAIVAVYETDPWLVVYLGLLVISGFVLYSLYGYIKQHGVLGVIKRVASLAAWFAGLGLTVWLVTHQEGEWPAIVISVASGYLLFLGAWKIDTTFGIETNVVDCFPDPLEDQDDAQRLRMDRTST
jgi:hypothetical protein